MLELSRPILIRFDDKEHRDLAKPCIFPIKMTPKSPINFRGQSVLIWGPIVHKVLLVGGGGGTVKIASASVPDPLNWNRSE